MGGAVNGLAAHGGIVRPYGSTFLQFADYMRGSIRLGALTGLRTAWVFTHDSVALGEDGPTHQPVEHLAALRAIPGLVVLRPADANETAESWRVILEDLDGPAAMALSRQDLPILDCDTTGVAKGAYVVREGTDVVLVGTGAELHTAIGRRRAARRRRRLGARRLDAVVGALRGAGRRLPRLDPAADAAVGLGRGRRLDGLVQVGRPLRLDRPFRRQRARRRGAREARHHRRERR